ncbi:ABC transporter permease [Nocardiopsis sp. CC223A]|uniref:ABC transporter permease n=1 Tax=Nocardiopsis sp. CC223A TaxID=3044051 RepID=UPI00278C85C2|nr:ABC transporter permease [Nocardiopsis sp. CC223A]
MPSPAGENIRTVWIIAEREIREKFKDRNFIASTGLIVFLISAMILITSFALDRDTEYTVGFDASDAAVRTAVEQQAETLDFVLQTEKFTTLDAVEEAIRSERVDIAIFGDMIITGDNSTPELQALLESGYQAAASIDLLASAELSDEQAMIIAQGPPQPERSDLSGMDSTTHSMLVYTMFGTAILYGLLALMGQYISQGVVEEKASRVFELLLTKVKAWQLLAGKLVGLGLVGLSQILLILLASGGVALYSGLLTSGTDLGLTDMLALVLNITIWFVCGYVFFSALFAIAGSLAARQEDLQSVQTPAIMILAISVSSLLPAASSPEGEFTRFLSIIPPFSPAAMPIRSAVVDISWWEYSISFLLLAVGTVLMISFGGRIYKGSMMRVGGIMKIRDALSRDKE